MRNGTAPRPIPIVKTALLINKFVPPDPSPTARLLGDLGELLEQEGWEVRYLGLESGYRAQTSHLFVRLLREVGFHLGILCQGLFSKPRPDLVIAFSSPPGLLITAAWIARCRGARLIHWCMDLYPDVAVALGVLSENGLPNRILRRLLSSASRNCERIVALDEDMADRFRQMGMQSVSVQPPWPPTFDEVKTSAPSPDPDTPSAAAPEWLYSGNLGRAHEWGTLLEAQRLLEEQKCPLRLVFQGGGNQRTLARAEAERLGLRQCEWREFAEPGQLVDQLHRAEALVVSQRPETEGMLFPSKLSTYLMTDTPLVWIGSTRGAIAEHLRNRPFTCLAEPDDPDAVAGFLTGLSSTRTHATKDAIEAFSDKVRHTREAGLEQWRKWVSPPE